MSLIEGHNSLGDAASGIAAIRAFLAELTSFEKEPDATFNSGTGGSLSGREVEVLGLISAGKSNQQIADELVLSIRTVERHINHIYAKIGVHTKAQATAYALRHELS
jgi:DNA-binding NarL/FixJ family response regulator